MTRTSFPILPRQWRPPLAWLLVLALLWAQLLGLAHRVWHAPQAGAISSPVMAKGVLHGAELQAPAAGLLAHLLGGGTSDPDCRVFDQLGHADSLPAMPVLALVALPPPFLVVALELSPALRSRAPFAARAPPVAR